MPGSVGRLSSYASDAESEHDAAQLLAAMLRPATIGVEPLMAMSPSDDDDEPSPVNTRDLRAAAFANARARDAANADSSISELENSDSDECNDKGGGMCVVFMFCLHQPSPFGFLCRV